MYKLESVRWKFFCPDDDSVILCAEADLGQESYTETIVAVI